MHGNENKEQRCRDKTGRKITRGRTKKSRPNARYKRAEMRKRETRKKNKNDGSGGTRNNMRNNEGGGHNPKQRAHSPCGADQG